MALLSDHSAIPCARSEHGFSSSTLWPPGESTRTGHQEGSGRALSVAKHLAMSANAVDVAGDRALASVSATFSRPAVFDRGAQGRIEHTLTHRRYRGSRRSGD